METGRGGMTKKVVCRIIYDLKNVLPTQYLSPFYRSDNKGLRDVIWRIK